MNDETPKTYKTLEALVEENLETIKEGGNIRPYKVTPQEGKSIYALTNSPGRAALALCEVETCSQKDIKTALLNNLLDKSKAKP